MKRFRIFYFLVVFSLLYVSCMKDDDTAYYSVLGTIEKTNDSLLIITDDDERLLVNNRGSLSSFNDADRLIAYFTMSDQAKPAGVDYVIDVYSYTPVLLKGVTVLTPEITDSIGNDPVDIAQMWISKDYLNVNFQYYAGNPDIKHYINLIRYPGDVPVDTIDLEIRHNDNNDPQSYYVRGFVSFDLNSLRNAGDSVVLRIKAKQNAPPNLDKHLTYKF